MATPDFVQVVLQVGTNLIETGTGDWSLDHIERFRTIDVEVSIEENASSHGGFIRQSRYPSRVIPLVISSERRTKEQLLATRLQLQAYIDFLEDATLTINDNGVTRIAKGRLLEAKIPDEQTKKTTSKPVLMIKFLMPDPFFLDQQRELPLSTVLPALYSPLSVFPDVGILGGLVVSGNEITFTVGGQDKDETGFELTMVVNAVVVNPKVTHQDGKYIRLLGSYSAGQTIVISTIDMVCTCDGVEQERDIRSKMFYLNLGSNTLTISADSGVDNLTKTVRFFERYR